MSVQSSLTKEDLAAKLKTHAESTKQLHAELRAGSASLDTARGTALRAAVDKHAAAYDAFSDDAQGCVGPTH